MSSDMPLLGEIMRQNCINACLFVLMLLLASACSSGSDLPQVTGRLVAPDNLGLPTPAELQDGPRAVNVADAGDYNLQLDQIWRGRHATADGGNLQLDASLDNAWVIYQISGFDGDMFPLSAHVELSGGTSTYSVGFADYDNQRWRFAGPYTGSADIDVPFGDGLNHPYRLVSDFGNCFMVLVADGPDTLNVSGIQLEVFGGSLAPAAPYRLTVADAGDSIDLSWEGSTQADLPDFAGYLLERAPFNGSSYTEVYRGRPLLNTYRDEGVVPLSVYRYRICSVDSNDNRSEYAYNLSASAGQGLSEIVAVLDMPVGPLFGPVQVNFDLSDSYVTNGGSIDSYALYIGGYDVLSGLSSSYTLTLQPGCYRVSGSVVSGVKTSTTVRYLRVLPRWQEDSTLVADLTGNMSRMLYARSARLPDGRLVHCGYDEAVNSINIWVEEAGSLKLYPLWAGPAPIIASCDPVLIDGVLHFGMSSAGNLQIVSCDGFQATRFSDTLSVLDDEFCLVSNATGQLGAFFEVDNAGSHDIVYVEMFNPYAQSPVVLNVAGGVRGLDAVYNPTVGGFDICYGDNLSMIWEQWSSSSGHLAGGTLQNFKVNNLDLELDPATQRSAMLATLDVAPFQAWYLYQQETGFWSLPEYPDLNTEATSSGKLLCTPGGPFIINQVQVGADDYFRLYGRSNDMWEMLSEQLTMDSAESRISLLEDGSEPLACLPLKSGNYAVRKFVPGSSPVDLYDIAGEQDGYRGELHAAAGADGLHAVWLNRSYGELEHFSSTNGATWTDKTPVISNATDLDLASTSTGEVYLSLVDVNSTELYYWDAPTFISQQAYPGLAGYRPSLMSQPTNEKMFWYVHLQPANALRFVEGNQTVPFSFVAVNPAEPTWLGTLIDGGFSFPGVKPRWWCLSGSSITQADLAFHDYNHDTPEPQLQHQNQNQAREVWGRTMDSCLFDTEKGPRQSVWLVNSSGLADSVLLKPNLLTNAFEAEIIPVENSLETLLTQQLRLRTVNMAQADGATAVVMEAGLFGNDSKLLWSNFGDFRHLPLPKQINPRHGALISSPELLIDMNGRWHIIYLDLYTNEMRCISTVE
jgi:hypothetical protein